MKILSRIINALLYSIVTFLIVSSIGSTVTKKPLFLTAVRSNSMYPLFQRGDMLLIQRISSKTLIKSGDIIVFKTEEGNLASEGWVSHRIVSGNDEDGYITKGDANERTDQDEEETKPIKRDWISNRVITLGSHPIKIPLMGYLPLWMEKYQRNPYLLPVITLILAIIIGVSEFFDKKRDQQKRDLSLPMIYFFSGLTISIMLCASMLSTSQHLSIIYEVSETEQGVIMGSNVGILKLGETAERPLSELNNKSIFPIIATATTNDSQISINHDKLILMPHQQVNTTMKVTALKPGKFQPTIHVGMFFPFLPASIVYSLAKKSYWLALAIISLIPGLPIMLYPLIDSKLSKKIIKKIRHKFRRIKNTIPNSI